MFNISVLQTKQLLEIFADFQRACHYDPQGVMTERLKQEFPGITPVRVMDEILARTTK